LAVLFLLSAISLVPGRAFADDGQSLTEASPRFATGPGGARPTGKSTPTPKPTKTPTKTSSKATKTPTKTSGSSTTKPSKPTLKGNVYTGANKAFTVTFDDTLWEPKAIEPDSSGYEGLQLNSDGSIGWVEVFSTGITMDDCVTQSMQNLDDGETFSDVVKAPDLAAPKTAKGASGAMITLTIHNSDGSTGASAGYIECRPLVKGKSIIRVEFITAPSRLDEVIPTWNDLLAGIKIAKTSSSSSKATPTPKKKTPTPTSSDAGDFPNVDGTTYSSPAYGFTWTWPDSYQPVIASGDEKGDLVMLANGKSVALVFTYSTAEGATAESCLAGKENTMLTGDNKDVAVGTQTDGTEARGTTDYGVWVVYDYTSDTGKPSKEYMECDMDPTGSYIVDFTFIVQTKDLTSEVVNLAALTSGIKFP
jgi:hypothetical protein